MVSACLCPGRSAAPFLSRRRRPMAVHCRPGTVPVSESAMVPDQRCTVRFRSRCIASGTRRLSRITPPRRGRARPRADRGDVGAVGLRPALEHGRARDQRIGAGRVTRAAFSAVTPPSISMSIGRPPTRAATCANLVLGRGNEFLAAEAGIDRHHQHEVDDVDHVLDGLDRRAGFSVTPAFLPSARIACSERCRCGPASTCTVMMSAPALAKASRYGSTRRDHQVHVERLLGHAGGSPSPRPARS